MIALDTETTGVDFHHGSRPFFVTTCNEDGENRFWEWSVDPLTREVDVQEPDLAEIRWLLKDAHGWGTFAEDVRERHVLVLQNARFDVAALESVGVLDGVDGGWPWHMTRDTLLAAHLLASNQPHDLTSLAMHYLGVDILPFEENLGEVVKECRRAIQQARLKVKRGCSPRSSRSVKSGSRSGSSTSVIDPMISDLAEWRISEAGLAEMPSSRGDAWKSDLWLPGAMRRAGYFEDRPEMDTVLADYSNTDSAVTLSVWKVMSRELTERRLWKIYYQGLRLLPIIYEMEREGVTLSRSRLESLKEEFAIESKKAGTACISIGLSMGYDLDLPKNGVNKSLRGIIYGDDRGKWLDLPRYFEKKSRTGEPSISRAAMDHWEQVLPTTSPAASFVRNLKAKRKVDTSIQYLEGYGRFWLPIDDDSTEARIEKTIEDLRYEAEGGDELASICLKDLVEEGLVTPEWYAVYPRLNPTGSATLRFSSENPNEQSVSKQEGFNLRRCFGPRPGREWWALDYQNLELRIPTFRAGETELIEVFNHPEREPYYGSYHLVIFDLLYPDLFKKHGKDCKELFEGTRYKWIKNGNFAVIYGAQADTADRAYRFPGAYLMIKKRFPRIAELNQRTIALAEKVGYIETIPDRSVDPERGYPLLCTRTDWGRVMPTVPFNYLVQGTAMWLTRQAMIKCQERILDWRQEGFTGRINMQVHDELDLDFPASVRPIEVQVKERGRRLPGDSVWRVLELRDIMASCGDDVGVPTPVSVTFHPVSWGEGTTLRV